MIYKIAMCIASYYSAKLTFKWTGEIGWICYFVIFFTIAIVKNVLEKRKDKYETEEVIIYYDENNKP